MAMSGIDFSNSTESGLTVFDGKPGKGVVTRLVIDGESGKVRFPKPLDSGNLVLKLLTISYIVFRMFISTFFFFFFFFGSTLLYVVYVSTCICIRNKLCFVFCNITTSKYGFVSLLPAAESTTRLASS